MIAERGGRADRSRGRSGSAALVAAASSPARIDAGAERRQAERALDLGRDRPGAVALIVGDIVERGAAQAAARATETRSPPGRLVLPAPFGADQHHEIAPTSQARRRDSCGNASAPGGECGQAVIVQRDCGMRRHLREADDRDPDALRSDACAGTTAGTMCDATLTPASASARRARPWRRVSWISVGEPGSASLKHRDLAFDLGGDVEQIARVEADIERRRRRIRPRALRWRCRNPDWSPTAPACRRTAPASPRGRARWKWSRRGRPRPRNRVLSTISSLSLFCGMTRP